MPPRERRVFALVVGVLVLTSACTSSRQRRERIEAIDVSWRTELEADSLEELVEHVRALGSASPDDPESWASIAPLCRQVLGSPSALVRSEALRAAWRLAVDFPPERLQPDTLPPGGFSEKTRRFEELLADPDGGGSVELLELADFMGRYRFGPAQPQLAVNLADVIASRALWEQDQLQQIFLGHAPGSLFHALTLVTLQAAGDSVPFVREEALRSARYLHEEVAVDLLGGSLQLESDSLLLLAALDSLAALAPRLPAAEVERLLALLPPSDVAVNRRADELRGTGLP